MIAHQHSQLKQYKTGVVRLIVCTLMFIDLTVFFFISFMNICFDTLVSDPPKWVLTILFLIMGSDLLALLYFNKGVTWTFFINLTIMLLLVISWVVNINWIVALSAGVFLRFPEIIQYNEIIQTIIRPYDGLFKFYTICKIFYVIMLVSHVFGCIFYAIDNVLIKMQYYGPIQLNPLLYYQADLLCFSPINSLDEMGKYIYSLYYLVSLMTTVAYGDIIPKNPWENGYVCILLIISTISIAFIIEQLLIVLTNNWETVYAILKKIKYFDSMLEKTAGVTRSTRLKLINFTFHSMIHEANHSPDIRKLTPVLQFRLLSESIGSKSNNIKKNEDKNNLFVDRYTLPNFLMGYILLKLELVYYPGKYLLVDNENPLETPSMFITSRGQLKMGYGPHFLMKKVTYATNRLLCWREFIWNTKSIHPQFKLQTKGLCQLYTFSCESLQALIQDERAKNQSNQSFSKMLEIYHVAKQKQLLLLYEESIDQILSTESMRLIDLEETEDQEEFTTAQLVSKHIPRCWGCGNRTHFPINCPNFHYKTDLSRSLTHFSRLAVGQRKFVRKNIVSEKRRPQYKKISPPAPSYSFFQAYISQKKEQLEALNELINRSQSKVFEKYERYDHFFPAYNFGTFPECDHTASFFYNTIIN